MQKILQKATVGGGCFWCVEAVYQRLKGVSAVESGYAGGKSPNVTYREVCSEDTRHAEVVQVTFDPQVIPYNDILRVFFLTHDPTTPNQQGRDIGPQYRSVIFYHDEQQKNIAEEVKKQIEDMKYYKAPIVTEIAPLKNYCRAESEHQNFYNYNPSYPYCMYVVQPKVDKFLQMFHDKAQKSI